MPFLCGRCDGMPLLKRIDIDIPRFSQAHTKQTAMTIVIGIVAACFLTETRCRNVWRTQTAEPRAAPMR